MNLEINENFSGRIKLWGCDCYFTVSGFIIKVFPVDNSQYKKIYDYVQLEDFNCQQWIYGIDEYGYDIAIHISQKPKLPLTRNHYIYFNTPLIIKSTANCLSTDLSQFQKILFVGGTINIVHNPKIAIDIITRTNESIKFTNRDKYTAKYDLDMFGEKCELSYSIISDREDGNITNSSLGNLESYIGLDFDKPQSIERILDCFKIIRELLAFCVGQYNVEINMRLHIGNQIAVCKIQQDIEDYVKSNFTQVIQIGSLGDKLPNLLKLLNDDKMRPYLQFFPYRNRDIYFMSIANVRDICSSLEREYKLQGITGEKFPGVFQLISSLKQNVKDFKANNKDKLSDDFYNLVNTTLGFIELPAKEQIMQLYRRYQQEIKNLTEKHINMGIGNAYTEDQFKDCVQSFVKLRNNATHSGEISFEKQAAIYYHLVLIVYLSVLDRVGFSKQDSEAILSWLFSNKF